MGCDNIGLRQQRIQFDESTRRRLRALTGWVVLQDPQPQGLRFCDDAAAYVPNADDAERLALKCKPVPAGKAEQSGGDILGDTIGIAAGGVAPVDTVALQVVDIEVIRADGGRSDEADATSIQ